MSLLSHFFTMLRYWVLPAESSQPVKAIPASSSPQTSPPSPPPSYFVPLCHPLVDSVSKEVEDYFLENWDFGDEKARKKFVAAGFSRVTCLYFPKALDDRIHFACRLLTVLFLIDDVLEHMSFAEGSAYNEKLIPISRGDVLPNRSEPAEYILYDLWESMRAHDKEMADIILEPVFVFMRAQTDKIRSTPMGLGKYFEYREKDVGRALLAALMRFSMGLRVTEEELATARELEQNCSKHLSVINDIFSYEKEVKAAQTLHEEGGVLCSSVQIIANDADLSADAAKRLLLTLSREWELSHKKLVANAENGRERPSPALSAYLKGLEYQMSGNELWSRTTKRYNQV